jgi:hypothetical protein
MNAIEIFGVDLFLGAAAVGAALSLGLWLYVMARIRPALVHGPLHTATVLLATAAFVSLDLVLLWGLVLRPDPILFRMAVAFVFGIQTVAAIAAVLMLRQMRRRRA